MDSLYVFVYKLKSPQTDFYQTPYYACSSCPHPKDDTQDHLDYWIDRGFADPAVAVIIPIYLPSKTYKEIIGDSTFCTREKVNELLVRNALAAEGESVKKIFPVEEFRKALKIPPVSMDASQFFSLLF